MGTMSGAEVARAVGCSAASVSRHRKRHLLPSVAETMEQAAPDLASLDILAEMRELYESIREHLDRADETNNWQAIRAFHAEARRDLELLAKLMGELAQEGTINIVLAPEWVELRTTILAALVPHPAARLAVARALEDGHAGG